VQGRGAARVVHGVFNGAPNQRYQVELFGNTAKDGSEAERVLGTVQAVTDAQGQGRFAVPLADAGEGAGLATVTATLTSALGATSPLSAPLALR